MRLLIASMMMVCCLGYSQETADAAPEAPVEITTTDDAGDHVAVVTDSMVDMLDCGCGKGKGGKPKI